MSIFQRQHQENQRAIGYLLLIYTTPAKWVPIKLKSKLQRSQSLTMRSFNWSTKMQHLNSSSILSNHAHDTYSLSIGLLGSFRLHYQGKALNTINTTRLQALMAYLVLHRDTPVARQRLSFLFWPDSSEAQARTNLRNLLHKLRAAEQLEWL